MRPTDDAWRPYLPKDLHDIMRAVKKKRRKHYLVLFREAIEQYAEKELSPE